LPSTELTSTEAPPEPAADLQALWPRRRDSVADGHPAHHAAFVHPEAAGREPSAPPCASRSRCPAARYATARWIWRALGDSARAWALAAGVPPDLYN